MKKKFGLIMAAGLAAVALTGCLDSSDDGNAEKVRPVEPGLYIYSAASSQNDMALQPAGIALRLAVLRSEAEAQGKPDELDQVFVAGEGNLKTLLFGANTKITQNGGTYEIAYAGAGGMEYDPYARIGTVRVNTGGNALEDTGAGNPWIVTLASDKLIVSGTRSVTITSAGNTSVYRQDGGCKMTFRGSMAYIDNKLVSNWNGDFVWTPEKGADDLSFSALKGSLFGFAGSASGSTFWTLNNASSVRMAYELTDGKYNPAQTGSHIAGGVETALLTDPADYDAAAYPSPEVKIAWTMKDKRLYYTVAYNGNSVEFNY